MLNTLNTINEYIKNNNTQKSDFLPLLAECDMAITKISEKYNTVHKATKNPLSEIETKRLNNLIHIQKTSNKKPEVAWQEGVKKTLSYFDKFVSKYKIGLVEKVLLKDNGYVYVEFVCIITNKFTNPNKASSEKTFQKQIKFLEEIGLELDAPPYSFIRLKNSIKNISILENLFKEKGCTQIEFSIINNTIDKIKLVLPISETYNFNENPIEEKISVSNIFLNEDEIFQIQQNIKEILHLYTYLENSEEKISSVYFSLIENYFTTICSFFNFEGKVFTKINNLYKERENDRTQIELLEKEVENILTPEQISALFMKYKTKIKNFVASEFSFKMSDCYIDRYGILSADFEYIYSDFDTKLDIPSEEYLTKLFDTSKGNRCEENFLILNTNKNYKMLSSMLTGFCPSIEIKNITSENENNLFFINKFQITITDFSFLI